MTEAKTTWDHSKADRPYLRGYAFALLRLENPGERQLASMISNAENADELLNYDSDMIRTATNAVLEADVLGSRYKPDDAPIWRLAKSLRRHPEIYQVFVEKFAQKIGPVVKKSVDGEYAENNRVFLGCLAQEFAEIGGSISTAYISAAASGQVKKAQELAPHP